MIRDSDTKCTLSVVEICSGIHECLIDNHITFFHHITIWCGYFDILDSMYHDDHSTEKTLPARTPLLGASGSPVDSTFVFFVSFAGTAIGLFRMFLLSMKGLINSLDFLMLASDALDDITDKSYPNNADTHFD